MTRIREPDGTLGPLTRIGTTSPPDYPPSLVAYGDRRAGLLFGVAFSTARFTERTD